MVDLTRVLGAEGKPPQRPPRPGRDGYQHARDFLSSILASDLKRELNLDRLRQENQSFVTDELKEYFSDLVYTCPIRGSAVRIALLLEHKSRPETHIHLQLLRYMLGIWEANRKQREPLRPVLPIVVYHGKQRWKVRSLRESFRPFPGFMRPFLPEFEYLVTDFGRMSDEELESQRFHEAPLGLAASLMKHISQDPDLKAHLRHLFRRHREFFGRREGIRFLKTVVKYILDTTGMRPGIILKTASVLPEKVRDKLKTGAQLEREEGREEGREQGMRQGRLAVATKMLAEGFGWDLIEKIAGVSKSEYQRLKRKAPSKPLQQATPSRSRSQVGKKK